MLFTRGEDVALVDIEYAWTMGHEDLALPANLIFGTQYSGFGYGHGTAVLGELIGAENSYGVTGIAPLVNIGLASPCSDPACFGYNVSNAINHVWPFIGPGDVILIEQQYQVSTNDPYLPVEFNDSEFQAIRNATAESVNDFETVTLAIYCTTFNERSSGMRCESSIEGVYCESSSVTKSDPGAFWIADFTMGGLIHAISGNLGGEGGRLTNLSGWRT